MGETQNTAQRQLTALKEKGKMRRVIIIMSCLLTFIFTGGFICINQKIEQKETIAAKQIPTECLTDSMAFFIPNPMLGFPLY